MGAGDTVPLKQWVQFLLFQWKELGLSPTHRSVGDTGSHRDWEETRVLSNLDLHGERVGMERIP